MTRDFSNGSLLGQEDGQYERTFRKSKPLVQKLYLMLRPCGQGLWIAVVLLVQTFVGSLTLSPSYVSSYVHLLFDGTVSGVQWRSPRIPLLLVSLILIYT